MKIQPIRQLYQHLRKEYPSLVEALDRIVASLQELSVVQAPTAPKTTTVVAGLVPDVSNIQLISIDPVEDDLNHDILAEIKLSYTAPNPLGDPPNDFQGVDVYIGTPDKRVQYASLQWFDGTGAGDTGHVTLDIQYPRQSESWRIYLAARSATVANKFDPNSTPYIDVDMPADPLGAAPDVVYFHAGTVDANGNWTEQMSWDPTTKDKMRVDWAALAPDDRMNWSGIAIYVRAPVGNGYFYNQVTGVMTLDFFHEADGDHYIYSNTPLLFEAKDIPNPPELWRFICVSYNRRGEPNVDQDGNPTGPYVDLQTLPLSDDVIDFTAHIEYGVSEAGDDTYHFYGSWTNPTDPRFKGVKIVAVWPDTTETVLAIEQEGSTSFSTDYWPIVGTASQQVIIYADTIFGDNTLKYGKYNPAAPHVTLTLTPQIGPPGQERAPLVSNATASVDYSYDEQSGQRYLFYGSWTNPTDTSKFRGVKIVARIAGSEDRVLAIETEGAVSFRTDSWPVPSSPESWDIYFVSIDANNRANTITDITPKVSVTVQRQIGDAGQEYAPLVTNCSASRTTPIKYADTTNFNSPGGVELYGFTLSWTNPSSPSLYTGCRVYACFSGEGIHKNRPLCDELYPSNGATTDQWPLTDTLTVDLWFVSYRGNLENTIVSGVTPKVTLTITKSTPGTIVGSRVTDIPTASFASSIRPVLLVSTPPALPNTLYPPGTIAYVTTTGQLIKVDSTGNSWQPAVNGATDIVANSVTSGVIRAGAIGTSQLYAGEILVGQGGGKPTRFKVVDSSGSMLAFIGDDSSVPFTGGYFRNIKIGPTISDIRIEASGSGVSINNANIAISASDGFNINIDPTNGIVVTGLNGSYYNFKATMNYGFFRAEYLSSPGMYFQASAFGIDLYYSSSNYVRFLTANSGISIAFTYASQGRLVIISGVTTAIDMHNGEYRMEGSAVINANSEFVGHGVVCPNYPVTAANFFVYYDGTYYGGVTQSVPFLKPDNTTGHLLFYGGIFAGVE